MGTKPWNARNRDKMIQYRRAWRSRNKDKVSDQRFRERRKLKTLVISKYGGRCACCGEDRIEFMTIDHIKGGGKAHRAQFKGHKSYYKWLLVRRRAGFRVLCHNCNFAASAFGRCPHRNGVTNDASDRNRARRSLGIRIKRLDSRIFMRAG